MLALDIRGHRFGRLIALNPIAGEPGRRRQWLCQCDCGAAVSVVTAALRTGNTRSCGCLSRETAANIRKSHGLSRTPSYAAWGGMIARCTDPKHTGWPDYGGRGIKVCDRWRDYALFLADMGERPSPRHSIDRLDNNGDYEPGNCKWATRKEQNNNSRHNRTLSHAGLTMNISAWAEKCGVPYKTFYQRVARKGIAHAIKLGGPND